MKPLRASQAFLTECRYIPKGSLEFGGTFYNPELPAHKKKVFTVMFLKVTYLPYM